MNARDEARLRRRWEEFLESIHRMGPMARGQIEVETDRADHIRAIRIRVIRLLTNGGDQGHTP